MSPAGVAQECQSVSYNRPNSHTFSGSAALSNSPYTIDRNVGPVTGPITIVAGGELNIAVWNVGTLASGSSVTLRVAAKVTAKAGSTLTNTASVSSTSPLDPTASNNSATATT